MGVVLAHDLAEHLQFGSSRIVRAHAPDNIALTVGNTQNVVVARIPDDIFRIEHGIFNRVFVPPFVGANVADGVDVNPVAACGRNDFFRAITQAQLIKGRRGVP